MGAEEILTAITTDVPATVACLLILLKCDLLFR